MAIERGNPIPAGRYWIDVSKPRVKAYTDWRKASNGAVRTVSTQESDRMTFIVFEVSTPTPRWPVEVGLGLPTIAEQSVKSASDVVSRPAVPTSSDFLGDMFKGVSPLALLAILYFMSKGK